MRYCLIICMYVCYRLFIHEENSPSATNILYMQLIIYYEKKLTGIISSHTNIAALPGGRFSYYINSRTGRTACD